MASFCDARVNRGQWSVRIDDIDPLREVPGAASLQLSTLEAYGFAWDGEVIYQSQRQLRYREALESLNALGKLYICTCSRKKLTNNSSYPGYCRPAANVNPRQPITQRLRNTHHNSAIRMLLNQDIGFVDGVQGKLRFNPRHNLGDPILLRRDNLTAYALACAMDDCDEITCVVRGADLLNATAVQLAIMVELDLPQPAYAHVPVATNSEAQKLGKQTGATALSRLPVLPTLVQAWKFLGQSTICVDTVTDFWSAAQRSWSLDQVPRCSQLPL